MISDLPRNSSNFPAQHSFYPKITKIKKNFISTNFYWPYFASSVYHRDTAVHGNEFIIKLHADAFTNICPVAILITLLKFLRSRKIYPIRLYCNPIFCFEALIKNPLNRKILPLDILNYTCTFYKFHIFFNFNGIKNVKNFFGF